MPVGTASAEFPDPSPDFQLRYRVVEELGRGSMGVVYRAIDVDAKRDVAVKFPPLDRDDLRQRCVTEARLLTELVHPNIVRCYDSGFDEGRPYVVMEMVRGVPLSRMLEKAERMDLPTVVILVCQVLDGLMVAHERGIVHRDIKPENVLVIGGSIAMLADFGLARLIASERMTAVGTLMGTPAYMAPEYVQGQPPDSRCDLYSVGVMLFELLTGHVPFEGDDPNDVLTRQIVEPPPRLAGLRPDLPPRVDELVMRLLSKRPAERARNAADVATELRRTLGVPSRPERMHDASLNFSGVTNGEGGSPGWVMIAMAVGLASAMLTIGLMLALTWATGASQ